MAKHTKKCAEFIKNHDKRHYDPCDCPCHAEDAVKARIFRSERKKGLVRFLPSLVIRCE